MIFIGNLKIRFSYSLFNKKEHDMVSDSAALPQRQDCVSVSATISL